MQDEERYPNTLESPPTASQGVTTACQYCVVGCGYEAHVWEGDGSAQPPMLEQANWISPAMTGEVRVDGLPRNAAVVPDPKCTMNRGNHSPRGGTQGRDLVFSIEDTSKRKERDSTRERLTTPYLHTKNGYEPISTERALGLLTALVKRATGWKVNGNGVVEFSNPRGLGVKLYEYQYLENTFAATRLLYQIIGTPNVAFHDRPSVASNTAGFEDSGIDPHGYSYEDIWNSDVLFLAGNNPYEAHSVFFMQYMTGKRIIVLDPRRTITADYAEKTGGLHLQPKVLGADTLVLNALARYIRDQQQAHPGEWIKRVPGDLIITDEQLKQIKEKAKTADLTFGPNARRRARYQLSLEEYYKFLNEVHADGKPLYTLERAAQESGIPLEKLELCARILAGPDEPMPEPDVRRVSLIFEKGLIWGYNYQNTAAMANLGLLLGSVLRPSDDLDKQNVLGVTGRAGGHQKGWAEVQYRLPGDAKANRGYPFHNSTDFFVPGEGDDTEFPVNHYLDAHLVGRGAAPIHPRMKIRTDVPDINLFWIIGCNPAGQIANSDAKWAEIKRRQGDELPANVDEAEQVLLGKLDHHKLVIVQQDIYPNPTTRYADLILPAAGWGEHDFTRYTGERRLRLYSKFQDPPAHRLPDGKLERDAAGKIVTRCGADWEIFRHVAMTLLPKGARLHEPDVPDDLQYDDLERWEDSADLFKDMALHSNRAKILGALESASPDDPPRGHELLRKRKTEGFILPVKAGGTPDIPVAEIPGHRVPVQRKFPDDSASSKPYTFVRADWNEIEADFRRNLPRPENDEFVICNGRVNELWNTMFTHIRNETVRQRYPDDMPGTILEFHPDDAVRLGVTNGDVVEVVCEQIHMGAASASFKGVVSIQEGGKTPFLLPGAVFAIFSYPAMTSSLEGFPFRDFNTQAYVNNITTGYVDPVNPIAAVKYARGRVSRTAKRYEPQVIDEKGTPRYLGPSYAPRNRAFSQCMVADESERLEWKMRELIVQRGLPRFRLHEEVVSGRVADLLLDPDLFISKLRLDPDFRDGMRNSLDSMLWFSADPEDPRHPLLDQWTEKEKELARKWLAEISQEG